MSATELLSAVLSLPDKERGDFADAFNSVQMELDSEFNDMLRSRVRDYAAGLTVAISGEEFMKQLEAEE